MSTRPSVSVFSSNNPTPKYIQYLGKGPCAVFGMLVIYCLKTFPYFPVRTVFLELIAIVVSLSVHLWKRTMLLTIAGGTIVYMLLVQLVF